MLGLMQTCRLKRCEIFLYYEYVTSFFLSVRHVFPSVTNDGAAQTPFLITLLFYALFSFFPHDIIKLLVVVAAVSQFLLFAGWIYGPLLGSG